jgi:hypothetical protein
MAIITADPVSVAREALGPAALVREFDPLALLPETLDASVRGQALALIAQDASEIEWTDKKDPSKRKTYWRLEPAARRRVLASLVAEDKLTETLKRARPINGDDFADLLRAALTDNLNPEKVTDSERDTAIAAATFAAEALGPKRGDAASQAVATLRDKQSRHAEEQRLPGITAEALKGHSENQEILAAFAKDGNVPDADRLPEPAERALDTRPYLITGAPGVGKSALVANLVRARRGYLVISELSSRWLPRVTGATIGVLGGLFSNLASAAGRYLQDAAEKAPNTPAVLLDFHAQAIALGGELEWTNETTRQLGYGRDKLTKAFSDLRAAVRLNQSRLDPGGKSAVAVLAATGDMKDGLAAVLGEQGFDGADLLVVLDAFEEVTGRSFPANDEALPTTLFGRVLLWVDSLTTLKTGSGKPVFSAVRVVVCGRDKPDMDQTRLARWFVAHRVIVAKPATNEKDSAEVLSADANLEATNALLLRLLRRPLSAGAANNGVTPEMIQAVAFPSLVLREITPDLLREVVAPAVSLEAVSPSQAKTLFERVAAEVWLVTKVPDKDVVRPRPDVRRVMLSAIAGGPAQEDVLRTLQERASRIHSLAADWYLRSANDDVARLEEAYHRAFVSNPPFAAWIAAYAPDEGARLCRRLADSAGEDLPAMPLASRALLRFYSVGPLRMTAEESAALPLDLAGKADVVRLEFARREGRARGGMETATTPRSSGSTRSSGPGTEVNEALAEETAPVAPGYRLYELLSDRDLAARVRYAFAVGDFDEAAGLGWTAIFTVPKLPDLSDPLRFADDPVMHWTWMAALARLVSSDQWPPADQIENLVPRVAENTKPERASSNPAGLLLAGAGTIALEGRLSPSVAASLEKLVALIPPVTGTHADLRILALHPLWLGGRRPPNFLQALVPVKRLQLLARDFSSSTAPMPGLDKVSQLATRITTEKMLSHDIDAYAASNEPPVLFSETFWRAPGRRAEIGRMLTGVQPELYDVAVFAVRQIHRKNYESVDQAIRETAAQATYWPPDAMPDNIPVRDRDRRASMIARAVVHADRCGLLPELLQRTTAQSDNRRLVQISDLAVRYSSVLRAGWVLEPVVPAQVSAPAR